MPIRKMSDWRVKNLNIAAVFHLRLVAGLGRTNRDILRTTVIPTPAPGLRMQQDGGKMSGHMFRSRTVNRLDAERRERLRNRECQPGKYLTSRTQP